MIGPFRYIIGIDEAGRGPIAGPLAVGAVAIPIADPKASVDRTLTRAYVGARFPGVKDSKQLSPAVREIWHGRLVAAHADGVRIGVSLIGASVIDRIGISRATRLALARALSRLSLDPAECLVLLDGLLYAPAAYTAQKTIVHGDATEPVIALASIAAKVRRDRLLVRLAERYPAYGFERHKGYGTRAHYAAITEHGMCPIHRRSFLVH